jgi:choline-sulfatase
LVQTPAPMAMMDWGIFPERDAEQDDHKVADWAIDQLRTAKTETGKPFFLSVGFRHPHVPCFASKSWFDLYPEDKLRLPPFLPNDRDDVPKFAWYTHWSLPEPRLAWLQESNQWKPLVRSYLASISYVDSEVGRVLEALKENGLAENTVVVLLSDHGFHLGEKGISGKNTLWERSTRVPLIVAGPGVRSGAVCSRPAELLDLYPTLSELCALSAPPPLDGHSLVPQLKDAKAARPWPAITTHGPNNHAVRTENWRYIRYADGSEELYDMRKDPNEWKNLAADARYAKQKQELVRLLPAQSAAPVPNSSVRLIEIREGVVYWEGKPIGANDPIPQ